MTREELEAAQEVKRQWEATYPERRQALMDEMCADVARERDHWRREAERLERELATLLQYGIGVAGRD